ncbi:MAG: hypothetical protein JNM72_07030 [Deltaproteobacteria bacterium]|nr:hypothetical protein [Deltaproteobacteria bacterium]
MSAFVRAPPGGHLTTFYSYKGGVGRTALLANVAFLLASWGRKVLCLDWDLEAPGLKRYLAPGENDGPGVLDIILGSHNDSRADWRSMRRTIPGPWLGGPGHLHFIDAGRHRSDAERYITEVVKLDFRRMAERGLGEALEDLREEWLTEYDHVLVDSRTGITDVGGICAAQLPDLLVLCVNMNAQSIDGAAMLAEMAKKLRASLPVFRGGFQVLPVPCKVTVDMESELEQHWQDRFLRVLGDHLRRALPPPVPDRDLLPALFPQLRVPWAARWAHGEDLSVLDERLDDLGSTAWGIANIAALVDTQLLHIGALLDQPDLLRPEGGPASRGELIVRLASEASAKADPMSALGPRAQVTAELKHLLNAHAHATDGTGKQRLAAALRAQLDPVRLDAAGAAHVAKIALEHIESETSRTAGWVEVAAQLFDHWFAAGVSMRSAEGNTVTLSGAGWNPENPALAQAWAQMAALTRAMVRVAPERGWQVVRSLGQEPTVGAPPLPGALTEVLEGLLRALLVELPPAAPPAARAAAEDALLQAALKRWCSRSVAADVLRARLADPVFLAWRCAHDPIFVVLDPVAAADQVLSEGQAAWWRAQVELQHELYLAPPPQLVGALVALHLGPAAVGQLLNALPEGRGSAGDVLVSAWAAQQPEPFAALLDGEHWTSLTAAARRRLLTTGWSAGAAGLSAAIRAAAQAAAGGEGLGTGLAADLRALRADLARVPDEDAAILLIALEQAVFGVDEFALLQQLVQHPGLQTRAAVDRWAYRAARAGRLSAAEVGALARGLTEAPAWLEGIQSLFLLRGEAGDAEAARFAALEQVVLHRLGEWIALPNPLAALGRRVWDLDATFARLMREQPELWWRWAALLGEPSGSLRDLVRGAPAEALAAALQVAPRRAAAGSAEARVYDQLVRALPEPLFEAQCEAALDDDNPEQAQRLLLARGLSAEHVDLLERIVDATDPGDDEALEAWGRRLLLGFGTRGYRVTGPFALPPDRSLADLQPHERDPQGAALRAAFTARAIEAPSLRARRFYAEVLRKTGG